MNKQPIAIIGAMAQEIEVLHHAMRDCDAMTLADMVVYRGILDDQDVVLMQCGIGKVNAAVGTTLLIDHFNAAMVINTGSAGALSDDVRIGDVVIAEALMHHDVDVTAFGYELGQMAQMPARYCCDDNLIKAAQEATVAFPDASVHKKLIVSGDQFIQSQKQREKISRCFPEALVVEMEAAAIAQVCYRFAIPFVVIRAVSDNANGQADVSFEQFLATAALHSAQMVRNILRHIAQ